MKLDVIGMAKEAGHRLNPAMIHELEAFAALVVEKCAEVCESLFDTEDNSCDEAEKCAIAIRTLIEKEE